MFLKKLSNLYLLFRIYKYISLRRKFIFLVFFILTSISAVFDVISIGLVIPFVDLMLHPDKFLNHFLNLKIDLSNYFFEEKNARIIITIIFVSSIITATLFRIFVFNLSQKISIFVNHEFNIFLYKKILNFERGANKKKELEESEILSSIQKADNVSNYINNFLNFCSSFLISIFIIAILIQYLDFVIIFTGISFVISYLALIFIFKRIINNNSFVISNRILDKNLHLNNTLGLFKEIILNNLQYTFFQTFQKINYQLSKKTITNNIIATIPGIILVNLTIILFAIYIFYLSNNTSSLISQLPLLSALVFGVQKCIPLFYQMYSSLVRMRGSYYQTKTLIDHLDSFFNNNNSFLEKKINLTFKNNIQFNNIFFRYDKRKYIIKNLNFRINKGEKILLNGFSGAGKTTFINIILGFLTPNLGLIKVDNKKIKFSQYKKFRHSISYCPQNIFLTKNNFMNNISLIFNEKEGEAIDKNKVIFCAKIASIDKYITSNKKGYNSEIFQGSKNLSGGQIQRIGIARALYKKSEIIIFDESTNSIDAKTELKILKNIFKFYKDKTIIFISHKNYQKSFFDKVYILKNRKLSLIK